ncbi:outer membrane protein OmpA-like peptidoglycan-associated protein/Tol biopolymer transport system component [Lewinella aquimaris]|uniref:Outer membrane protein OmpA-like peptidoglycan-associated protein/Tol biopolymer transport system component n=1 Tax=Neolewinella aquimaris TaxID=1835722 RepID=A0A840E6Q5_9BACT|nr:OmpA family protein [Neolewinella aquimaris]MBB4078887.1 outer membrane protein OmpA-like peptidoglycan-associated protein/Tol biopolymer transport system component [Neolewinella aquimaris]
MILYLLLVSPTGAAYGQSGHREMKARDLKELAAVQSLMTLQKFDEANQQLTRLLRKYPSVAELHYLSGEINRYQGNYDSAVASINRGLSFEGGKSPMAYRMLGDIHTLAGAYDQALQSYESYYELVSGGGNGAAIVKAERLVAKARTVADLASEPHRIAPTPLGPGINTSHSLEYFPSLSVDGKRMIFTRRVNRRQEDFYQSELREDSTWSEAVPLGGINTPMNEGAQTITADGAYLVFTGCGRPDGIGSCDLYFSERTGSEWSNAQNLGPAINSLSSESQPSLSRDGRLLFFASNRSGGSGNDDIYVAGRTPDGGWSRPVNLGPSVNTAGNDRYPYWAADNKTLYFTSTGRAGMGGADLFMTSVDENNKWREPVNLGYPINTPGEETNIFIGLDGKTAYFSKGVGDDIDIYSFVLPEKFRPAPATYVSVRVIDDKTGRPLQAEVRLNPLTKGSMVSTNRTDHRGRYLTVLPIGVDYGFTVEKSGYLFYSNRFVLTGPYSASEPYELTIRLKPVEKATVVEEAESDGAIVLRNVFFATASDALLDISTEELDRLVALLREQPDIRVEIAGHTDDVGSEDDNQKLSERRAASVKRYLVSQGIATDRIAAVGYGESRPVESNDTEEGRASNRRTTFRLLF